MKVTAPGATLLEIRLHAAQEAERFGRLHRDRQLGDGRERPGAGWRQHVVGSPVTVTVRTLGSAGLSAPSTSTFTVAPVGAGGQLVYWALRGFDASNPDNTQLYGFSVGEEDVTSVLTVEQVQETSSGVEASCIGCHTATPDGRFVGFTGNYPWPNALASVDPGQRRGRCQTSWARAGGDTLAAYWHGIITFSGQHWASGDHLGITSLSTQAVDPNASAHLDGARFGRLRSPGAAGRSGWRRRAELQPRRNARRLHLDQRQSGRPAGRGNRRPLHRPLRRSRRAGRHAGRRRRRSRAMPSTTRRSRPTMHSSPSTDSRRRAPA